MTMPCVAASMFARLQIVTYGTASSVALILASPARASSAQALAGSMAATPSLIALRSRTANASARAT
jgi:hypothetical protein